MPRMEDGSRKQSALLSGVGLFQACQYLFVVMETKLPFKVKEVKLKFSHF
jgi:hypothetical protein